MWYLKKFSTESDYHAFKVGEDWLTPNVSSIEDTNRIYYNPVNKQTEELEGELISITIRGVMPLLYPDKTYQVINGMTFEDFCKSKYNIDGWRVVESETEGVYYILHQYDNFITNGGRLVRSYEIINPDIYYYWSA